MPNKLVLLTVGALLLGSGIVELAYHLAHGPLKVTTQSQPTDCLLPSG